MGNVDNAYVKASKIAVGDKVINFKPYPTRDYGRQNIDLTQMSFESLDSFVKTKGVITTA